MVVKMVLRKVPQDGTQDGAQGASLQIQRQSEDAFSVPSPPHTDFFAGTRIDMGSPYC